MCCFFSVLEVMCSRARVRIPVDFETDENLIKNKNPLKKWVSAENGEDATRYPTAEY